MFRLEAYESDEASEYVNAIVVESEDEALIILAEWLLLYPVVLSDLPDAEPSEGDSLTDLIP